MLGVSLIICCHNSADKLPQTIKHVNELTVHSDIPWELIIVDNASTDGTSEIAAEILSPGIKKIAKIIIENTLGLRNARLRGIAESKYDYISFIDDDNWIHPDWITVVFQVMSEHPEIGACGGIGYPSTESTPPVWFDQYKACYAVGPQGESTGYVSDSRGYLWGAGLSIRRSAWEEIISHGFSFTLSGRHGANLSSGEDSEICYALRYYGWLLWYDERLSYYHYLPPFRLTWNYLKKLHRGFGASFIVLGPYREFFNSYLDNVPDFHNAWISDSRSIIKTYQARCMELLLLPRENEGSLKVIEFHLKLGELWAIIKLRNRYDDIKKQIYSFWQDSKVCQERSRSIDVLRNVENPEIPAIDSLWCAGQDEQIRNLSTRISALESSLSWRITKPLRWLGDKIRK